MVFCKNFLYYVILFCFYLLLIIYYGVFEYYGFEGFVLMFGKLM